MITVLDLQCTIIAILHSFDSKDKAFVLASYHIASQRSHGHHTARKQATERAHPRQKHNPRGIFFSKQKKKIPKRGKNGKRHKHKTARIIITLMSVRES